MAGEMPPHSHFSSSVQSKALTNKEPPSRMMTWETKKTDNNP